MFCPFRYCFLRHLMICGNAMSLCTNSFFGFRKLSICISSKDCVFPFDSSDNLVRLHWVLNELISFWAGLFLIVYSGGWALTSSVWRSLNATVWKPVQKKCIPLWSNPSLCSHSTQGRVKMCSDGIPCFNDSYIRMYTHTYTQNTFYYCFQFC